MTSTPRVFAALEILPCPADLSTSIHRIMGGRVDVYLIADGRRDMQALLERRLRGA